MGKLRVCIVGCGGIGKGTHAPALKKLENEGVVEVVALCDLKAEKMDAAEKVFDHKVNKYKDYKEMIVAEKPDMVNVCTPNYLHSEISCFCLLNGANVICEKPDAMTVAQVEEMAAAEKESGKKLMVIRNNRYHYWSQRFKKMIEDGEFGEIYFGRCGWIRVRGIPGKGGWFTTKALSGGGPCIDLGVHMIDLAIYLMGNPVAVSVSGATYCKFADNDEKSDSVHSAFGERQEGGTFDVEDLAGGFIKFENGASLQFEFSWASNIAMESNFVELRGTKKGLKWNAGWGQIYDGTPIYKGVLKKGVKYLKDAIVMAKNHKFVHYENIKHFTEVITKGVKPMYTVDQGINMIKILNGVYKSAETGKEVILK